MESAETSACTGVGHEGRFAFKKLGQAGRDTNKIGKGVFGVFG